MVTRKAKTTPVKKGGIKLPEIKIVKKAKGPFFISQKFYRIDRKTKQKYKAGMFYACLLNPDVNPRIGVGFSICNKNAGDRYDYVKGVYKKGFGIRAAVRRSARWVNYHHVHIGSARGFPVDNVNFVLIPTFAVVPFLEFLQRCEKYFWANGSKYEFPIWANALKEGMFNITVKENRYCWNLQKIIERCANVRGKYFGEDTE